MVGGEGGTGRAVSRVRYYKGAWEHLGENGYIYYLDCGYGSMSIYTWENLKLYT